MQMKSGLFIEFNCSKLALIDKITCEIPEVVIFEKLLRASRKANVKAVQCQKKEIICFKAKKNAGECELA